MKRALFITLGLFLFGGNASYTQNFYDLKPVSEFENAYYSVESSRSPVLQDFPGLKIPIGKPIFYLTKRILYM